MAYLYNLRHDSPRVGRSQGVLIFWGLISAVFAALFCYYFLKNQENEMSADKFRNDVTTLQEERDTLSAEKDKLQAQQSDADAALKTREDALQDKEDKLAAEEQSLGVLAPQNQAAPATTMQALAVKKFGDVARKLVKDGDSDIVVRAGRPVLRISDASFFAPGDTTLKPEGKAALGQIAQALDGQGDRFELRVESFTDSQADPAKPSAASSSHGASSWDLTAGRAAAISLFFKNQTALPFQNVLVVARGDAEPIVSGPKDNHARNRRLEITIAPVPAAFRSTDIPTAAASDATHLEPAASGPAPANAK